MSLFLYYCIFIVPIGYFVFNHVLGLFDSDSKTIKVLSIFNSDLNLKKLFRLR